MGKGRRLWENEREGEQGLIYKMKNKFLTKKNKREKKKFQHEKGKESFLKSHL